MDLYGYPEDCELEKIRKWNYQDGFIPLMDYVRLIWHWDNYFIRKNKFNFELHTGGWSGNESIIGALMDNKMFWLLCWKESKRGGHYKFEIRN